MFSSFLAFILEFRKAATHCNGSMTYIHVIQFLTARDTMLYPQRTLSRKVLCDKLQGQLVDYRES